jgi:hypothetical protein
MEKEYIPYEQALDLKELGFDEPCLSFYWITGKFYITAEYHNYVGFHKQNQLGDYNYDSISAPTFSQAFRWFREKYGLYHSIGLDGSLENDVNCDYQIINHNQSISELETDFKSYEKAELECLKKLIEIVKEKNE